MHVCVYSGHWLLCHLFVSTCGPHPIFIKMNVQKGSISFKSCKRLEFSPIMLKVFAAVVWIYKENEAWSQLQFHSRFSVHNFTVCITCSNCGPGLDKELVMLSCLFLLVTDSQCCKKGQTSDESSIKREIEVLMYYRCIKLRGSLSVL